MSTRKEIIKDAVHYSGATILTQGLGLLAAVLTRRFLGPLQAGMWTLVQVVTDYAAYSTLGVSEAAPREIPYCIGKGDHERAEHIKNTVFGFSIWSAVLCALAVAGYALWKRPQLQTEFFWGLLFAGVVIVLQRINNLLIVFLRAYKHFEFASSQMVFSAILNAVLVAALSYRFKIYGFMLALALSYLFNIFYIIHRSKLTFRRIPFSPKEIWALIQYGFPIQLLGIFNTILGTTDKMAVASTLGLRQVGLYGVALMGAQYLGSLPNALGVVLVPHFHEALGKRDNVKDLRNYLIQSSRIFTEIMVAFVGIAWFLIPPAMLWALPQFAEAIGAARWLLFGAFFSALSQPFILAVIAIRRHRYLLISTILLCAVAVPLYALSAHSGIERVAIASVLFSVLRFLSAFFLSAPICFEAKETARELVWTISRFALLCAAILGVDRLLPASNYSQVIGISIFMLVHLPLWILFWKHYKIREAF